MFEIVRIVSPPGARDSSRLKPKDKSKKRKPIRLKSTLKSSLVTNFPLIGFIFFLLFFGLLKVGSEALESWRRERD